MYTPHDYQEDCLSALSGARAAGEKRGLIVMASGLGKTFTIGFDVARFRAAGEKGPTLYLCDQNDILYQAQQTFENVLGNSASYGHFNGNEKTARGKDCVFASFQTLGNHLGHFAPDAFSYIAVDESHHAHAESYRSVIRHFTPKWYLGATATPNRLDGQDIRELFGQELFYLPLEVALARGLLTPVDYRLLADEVDVEAIKKNINSINSSSDLDRYLAQPMQFKQIFSIVEKHAAEFADPRIIYFVSSLKMADELCAHIPGALAIHSRVPRRERTVRLELFRQGLVPAVVTVDCFNEGIDIPQANVIVFLRSTESPNVFFQQLGRGLRKSEGKDRVIVLDFVANCERIKLVRDLWRNVDKEREKRERTSSPREPRAKVSDRSPLKFSEKAIQIAEVLESIRPKFISEIPRLAQDYSAKNEKPADSVLARTGALLKWQCYKCSFEWLSPGAKRLRGSKCPSCDGRVVTERNNFARHYPALVSEYSERNAASSSHVLADSRESMWWKCTASVCGYEWQEPIASRAKRSRLKHGCPECYERRELNQLSIEHPNIFAEYSERNVRPLREPWWNCPSCKHEWRSSPARRIQGNECPVCSGRTVSNATRLTEKAPRLARELTTRVAKYISIHSDRNYTWECLDCLHKWKATPRDRYRNPKCPACNDKARIAPDTPSVAKDSVLAPEYSPRNTNSSASISILSEGECSWDCPSCGFSYEASPRERIQESKGCPVCSTLAA